MTAIQVNGNRPRARCHTARTVLKQAAILKRDERDRREGAFCLQISFMHFLSARHRDWAETFCKNTSPGMPPNVKGIPGA